MGDLGRPTLGAERLDPGRLDRMFDRRLQPEDLLDGRRAMGHVLDLVVRDGGNLAWAQRENVLLQAAEHRAMDIQQVAGNADADDLAVAGAVELATRGEPAQQEVAM